MSEVLRLKKSNCKNCYKCIRHCPVKSIRFSGNQAYIVNNECILCGHCFVVCPQNAKQIASEREKVKVMLQSGDDVYISLAPSFIANYDSVGIESMREAVKALGFKDAEETAIGATIVKKEYERLLKEEKRDILISSCCHSINLLIQKYFPAVLPYLANILSPMQAHAVDIKKRHPNAKVVFVGPCVAKKDEAEQYEGIVDAVLSFEELTNWFKDEEVVLKESLDQTEESKARLFPTTGGILKTMDKTEGYSYLAIDGVQNCINALNDIQEGNIHNCFIEMSSCVGSCINGPVMEKYHKSPVRDYVAVTNYAGGKDFPVKKMSKTRLTKIIDYIDKKESLPTNDELKAIYKKMGKIREEDFLNCGSCGYNTCQDKAIAIFQGKADPSMCLPFLKNKAENFSDTIIHNTPNGILVLNDNFEVQQINKSALNLMNLRSQSDVMGEPVVRILDPKNFTEVVTTGKNIRNRRVYLAEYKKYVEQSIIYERDYNVFICIMRDITKEENLRIQKEDLNQQTIKITDNVVEKQMRIVQEIASLLGETAAETKIALTKLKESISNE